MKSQGMAAIADAPVGVTVGGVDDPTIDLPDDRVALRFVLHHEVLADLSVIRIKGECGSTYDCTNNEMCGTYTTGVC